MAKLTKMSSLAVSVQMRALLLMVTSGQVLIKDADAVTLATLPVSKAELVDNQLRCRLSHVEAARGGKAAAYSVRSGDDQELWTGTVGVKDANMLVRTVDFVPGVLVACDEFTHTMPYESEE